ncbi:MAG: hypothetical protein GWP05_10460, partial [Anaerolineaceae bacterium]|nr:hypothetical protein [Anaerolineaceae bacterium]
MWYSLRSIGAKFVITIGCFGVLLCCFLLYRTYVVGRRQARDLMNQQAALALEFDLAIREYVAEEIRPRTARRIGQDEFEP